MVVSLQDIKMGKKPIMSSSKEDHHILIMPVTVCFLLSGVSIGGKHIIKKCTGFNWYRNRSVALYLFRLKLSIACLQR